MSSKISLGILSFLLLCLIGAQGVLAMQNRGGGVTEEELLFPESELASLPDVSASYRDGQGVISLSCSAIPKGGIYVYLNGVVKLHLTTSEPKNLKVRRGDVILVKGHDLPGPVRVMISSMVGGLDASLLNHSVEVGNLAKHLTTIL